MVNKSKKYKRILHISSPNNRRIKIIQFNIYKKMNDPQPKDKNLSQGSRSNDCITSLFFPKFYKLSSKSA